MEEVESLIKKALKYKESGLTEHEISEELNVSKETAAWLLSKGKQKKPTGDVRIGWRSIGGYPSRISFISDALCDIILEECEEVDKVVGIAINGVPFSSFVADKLGLEMAVFRLRPRDDRNNGNYVEQRIVGQNRCGLLAIVLHESPRCQHDHTENPDG